MSWKKKPHAAGERLDDLGSFLVSASQASESEIEDAISSSDLYSRIRDSIATRQLNSPEKGGRWFDFLGAARFAIPAMALLAVVAASLPWLGSLASVRGGGPKQPSASTTTQSNTLAPATACSLSNTQECAISNNAVLATIFAEDNQEKQQ